MTQGDEDPLRKPGETILKPDLAKQIDEASHHSTQSQAEVPSSQQASHVAQSERVAPLP